jgi:hypothetical protein
MIPIGAKVYIDVGTEFPGEVVGYGMFKRGENFFSAYLVELDKGFYNPDKSMHVNIITATHANVRRREVEDEDDADGVSSMPG